MTLDSSTKTVLLALFTATPDALCDVVRELDSEARQFVERVRQ